MAESTLSVSYNDLQVEVGRFLGYDVDPMAWSDAVTAEVDRLVQAGVRRFYYPPAVEGVEVGHEWSFLKPTTTIDTVDGDGEQDMPDDFGRVVGDFHFEASVYASSIVVVSEHRIQTLLQRDSDENRPQYATIRFKSSDGAAGQRQEVVWWPTPNAAYTLAYRYEAFAGKLVKDSHPYPLGGMKYSELIVESCLAVAEQRANDEQGVHWEAFTRMLASAIAHDRKGGARYFGAMSHGETVESVARHRATGPAYDITYKGSTW